MAKQLKSNHHTPKYQLLGKSHTGALRLVMCSDDHLKLVDRGLAFISERKGRTYEVKTLVTK